MKSYLVELYNKNKPTGTYLGMNRAHTKVYRQASVEDSFKVHGTIENAVNSIKILKNELNINGDYRPSEIIEPDLSEYNAKYFIEYLKQYTDEQIEEAIMSLPKTKGTAFCKLFIDNKMLVSQIVLGNDSRYQQTLGIDRVLAALNDISNN